MPKYTVECDETEVLIPLSILVSRLEKHRDELKKQKLALPWYAFKKRYALIGAINAYQYEIDAELRIGGANNLDRILGARHE